MVLWPTVHLVLHLLERPNDRLDGGQARAAAMVDPGQRVRALLWLLLWLVLQVQRGLGELLQTAVEREGRVPSGAIGFFRELGAHLVYAAVRVARRGARRHERRAVGFRDAAAHEPQSMGARERDCAMLHTCWFHSHSTVVSQRNKLVERSLSRRSYPPGRLRTSQVASDTGMMARRHRLFAVATRPSFLLNKVERKTCSIHSHQQHFTSAWREALTSFVRDARFLRSQPRPAHRRI